MNQALEITSGSLTSTQIEKIHSNYFLKIMTEHFQVIVLLFVLPLKFPSISMTIMEMFIFTGSQDYQSTFSLECVLKNLGIDLSSPNYFVLFTIIVFDFLSFFFILAIEYIWRNYYRKKRNLPPLSFLWNFKLLWLDLLIYIILANHVGQVLPFLNQFFCINPDGSGSGNINKEVLISDLRILCESYTHQFVKYLVALPIILFGCVIIPFYVIFTLLQSKRKGIIYHRKILRRLGNFFFVYREQMYFFEIFVYLKRIIFILIQQYF